MSIRLVCCTSLGMIGVVSSVGCGGAGFRRDFLGQSGAQLASAAGGNGAGWRRAGTLGAASAAPGAGGWMAHAGDELEVQWSITIPQAERLHYAIACAGAASDPIEVGETLDEYRARRIAELRAKRDR